MSQKDLRSHCPINFGLETFGDKWSLLILRDMIFRGKKTYGEFLKSEEGFATNILATRLEHLEAEGILKKQADAADGRKSTYALTEKGLDLLPLLFEIILWSSKYDSKSEARRITKLLKRIKSDNRSVSDEVIDHIRQGHALFPRYLD